MNSVIAVTAITQEDGEDLFRLCSQYGSDVLTLDLNGQVEIDGDWYMVSDHMELPSWCILQ